MGNYISNPLINLFELFTSRGHKPSELKGGGDVAQLVEHVVDVVDPKIRVIGRYSQKLAQPVAHTWEYLNQLADRIPGGITLSRATFTRDPHMRLIFDTQAVVNKLLDTVIPLIDQNELNKAQASSQVYMLLCMEKTEHSFLGTELAGDILKRDVLQTKVTFSNRKFLSAGYNEEDAKLGFKKCAFEGLVNKAHGMIMESRKNQRQLIERKRQLHHQLHDTHASHHIEHSSIFSRNDYLLNASPELLEIERQLADIRLKSESPDHHLLQIIEVLNHPEQYLKVDAQSMTLNNLRVKLSGNASEHGININYAEVDIEQLLKRITMIVSCSREEIFSYKMH